MEKAAPEAVIADNPPATASDKPVAPATTPASVFDSPAEPFELRAPNGTGPVSVASAVANALYTRQRPAPIVAPESAPSAVPADEEPAQDNASQMPADVDNAPNEDVSIAAEETSVAASPQSGLPLDLPPERNGQP